MSLIHKELLRNEIIVDVHVMKMLICVKILDKNVYTYKITIQINDI